MRSVFLLIAFSPLCHGATITVDPHGGADFTEIQPAVDAANDGDTVIVRPGIYETGEPICVNPHHDPDNPESPRVKSIALRAADGLETTVIRLADLDVAADYASVALFLHGASTFDGFTLSGGENGVVCGRDASPIITGCRITENAGRGVVCSGSGCPQFIECEISSNAGGGFACDAYVSPTLISCDITGNAARSGGGLRVNDMDDAGTRLLLDACTISGNTASFSGGGIFCSDSSPLLVNCLIVGNSASSDDFESPGFGGAFLAEPGASLTFVNCTMAHNAAGSTGDHYFRESSGGRDVNCCATLVNCIVRESWFSRRCSHETPTLAAYDSSFVREGLFDFDRFKTVPIAGEVYKVPDFIVDPGDYHLLLGCPAIDAGVADGAPRTDIEGTERPCWEAVDIGAYEYCGDAAPDAPRFLRGDANGDGVVDLSDGIAPLFWLFQGGWWWLPCEDASDTNDDGQVNITDAISTLNWLFLGGPTPPFPGPATCGPDPSPDDLTCERYEFCH